MPERKTKQPADVALRGDVVRVSYESGNIDSVILTEIASVAREEVTQNPNVCLLLILMAIYIPATIAFGSILDSIDIGFGAKVALAFLASTSMTIFVYKMLARPDVKWDDVHVETRGGKVITYSVDLGRGVGEVDKIESFKRQLTRAIRIRDSDLM